MTAETIKNLFLGTYRERGGFFGVKRAQSQMVTACLLEHDILGNDINNIGDMLYSLDRVVWNRTYQKERPPF
jgi:hypothetical protein